MKKVKVSTREIVIIGIMLAVVLYGAYDFFIAPSLKPGGAGGEDAAQAAQIDALIEKVSKVLAESGPYPMYAAIVAGAESEWRRDPFYVEAAPVAGAPALGPVRYTGYLEIGTQRMAVIDGVSYEAGDELEVGGYRVKRIRPSAVVIEEKGTGKSVTVPLLEE